MKNIKKLTIMCLVLCVSVVGCSEVKKEYYESGALKSEYTVKNGKPKGPAKEYEESGELKKEIQL